jgi:hypothetical protein
VPSPSDSSALRALVRGGLQALGYQQWPSISADDVVALVRAEANLDA